MMWIGEEIKKKETRKILQNEVEVHFCYSSVMKKDRYEGKNNENLILIIDISQFDTISLSICVSWRREENDSSEQIEWKWSENCCFFSPHHRELCDSIGILKKKSNAILPYITQNKIISCNLKQSIHSTTQHSRVYMSEKRRIVEGYKLFAKQITGNTRNIFKGRKKSCWEWM